MIQLQNIVKYTKGQIMTLVQNKKRFVAIDKSVCMTVFDKLKKKEKYLK